MATTGVNTLNQNMEVKVDTLTATTMKLGGTTLTPTAAELNILAGVTPGTATASKAVVLGASKEIATITSATVTTLTAPNVAGVTAFASMFKIPIGADVAAAGSVIGDAAALLTGFQTVSAANGTKGVILPVTTGGDVVIIKGTANAVLKVWPQTGGQINAVGTSTAMSLASGLIPAIFISVSATQWYTLPLLPS